VDTWQSRCGQVTAATYPRSDQMSEAVVWLVEQWMLMVVWWGCVDVRSNLTRSDQMWSSGS